MFDPVELAKITEELVCKQGLRTYRRFRPARFYGGISTADCVGCCLRCVFCWSWAEVSRPEKHGTLFSAEDVAEKLVSIAKSKGFRQIRISGNEPTIGRDHLVRVLRLIPSKYVFILETNGILIGHDPSYAEELSEFPNVYVRVSLKGACEEEFSRLTGAVPDGFKLQLNALKNLVRFGVRAHPACMVSFSSPESLSSLRSRLREINPAFEDFEVEELTLWGGVEERLRRMGVRYTGSYSPECIPPDQV